MLACVCSNKISANVSISTAIYQTSLKNSFRTFNRRALLFDYIKYLWFIDFFIFVWPSPATTYGYGYATHNATRPPYRPPFAVDFFRCTLYGLCVLCVYILDINANLIERDNDSQLINNFIGYSFLHDSFTWETVNVVNVLWRFSLWTDNENKKNRWTNVTCNFQQIV